MVKVLLWVPNLMLDVLVFLVPDVEESWEEEYKQEGIMLVGAAGVLLIPIHQVFVETWSQIVKNQTEDII